MLKAVLDSLEGVSEALHEFYVEKDGKFYLDSDHEDTTGLKKALDAARKDKKGLAEKLDLLKKQVEELGDVEEVKKAMARIKELEEQQLKDEGKFEELLEKRMSTARKAWDAEKGKLVKTLEDEQTLHKETSSRLSKRVVDDGLVAAALKFKVLDTAMDDVKRRGREIFRLEEGDPVPYGGDGEKLYGKDPTRVLTMEEWVEGLRQDAPHLFQGSSGSGASPKGGGGSGRSGEYTITESEARDFAKYSALREKAVKEGKMVTIVRD